jgi:hypothetical protein
MVQPATLGATLYHAIKGADNSYGHHARIPTAEPEKKKMWSGRAQGGASGGGGSLSTDDARQIKERLFGKLGAPPSWKQGFFFNRTVRGSTGVGCTRRLDADCMDEMTHRLPCGPWIQPPVGWVSSTLVETATTLLR